MRLLRVLSIQITNDSDRDASLKNFNEKTDLMELGVFWERKILRSERGLQEVNSWKMFGKYIFLFDLIWLKLLKIISVLVKKKSYETSI